MNSLPTWGRQGAVHVGMWNVAGIGESMPDKFTDHMLQESARFIEADESHSENVEPVWAHQPYHCAWFDQFVPDEFDDLGLQSRVLDPDCPAESPQAVTSSSRDAVFDFSRGQDSKLGKQSGDSETMNLKIIALNAGGALGSADKLKCFETLMGYHCIEADLIFFSELDAHMGHKKPVTMYKYEVFRKWAGRGSRATGWAVDKKLLPLIRYRKWAGRCGALLIDDHKGNRIWIVGMHGAHGEACPDTFADCRRLLSRAPRGCPKIVIGDLNVDMLPVLEVDPWRDVPPTFT